MLQKKETQGVLEHFGRDFFGELTPLIADIDITDIDCNGRHVWATHVKKGKFRANIKFTSEDIKGLAYKISNTENVQFNVSNPSLEADLHDLRFHFTHNSFSVSGASVSIRKTPIIARIKDSNMKEGRVEYLSDFAKNLLQLAIKAKKNTVVCGLPGAGKTELAKFGMGSTNDSDRIITIEDTSELHLAAIYPEKDIVELKVNDYVDYEGAIKNCMRMHPVWVLLSETRGKEIKDLLKSVSSGAKIVTTLHTDDARDIPSRMLNMFEDNELSNDKIENMIYSFIDIGIHVQAISTSTETIRYVDQMVYYEITEDGRKIIHDLYEVKPNPDGTFSYSYNKIPNKLLSSLLFVNPNFKWGDVSE